MKDTDKHPASLGSYAEASGQTRTEEGLIPKHGGYKNTKTFQLAELIYDVTVLFCDKFIDRRSRTHDQMVQAARSGSRNLAEGSVDSGTSKKIEMKLTGISLGSLDELSNDYAAYLRQRSLPLWPPDHPALKRFKALRCATLAQFRAWVAQEVKLVGQDHTDRHGHTRTKKEEPSAVRVGPCGSVFPRDLPAVLAANGALCLLNLCMYLVKRQLEAQARAFEEEGGFTERLYRRRTQRRQSGGGPG